MSTDAERRIILQMIDSGKITAEEGLGLINALVDADDPALEAQHELPEVSNQQPGFSTPEMQEPEANPAPGTARTTAMPPDAERWRSWWVYPFWAGVAVVVLGGWLMYWVQQNYGIGFWFLCSWVPFILGVALMALAWQSRTSHWWHLRVHQKSGDWPRNIVISTPLPIGLASWFFRTFGEMIPGMEHVSMEDVLQSVDRNTSPENPVYIEVDQGEDGERVEIYIG